jgi:hypothetical protein
VRSIACLAKQAVEQGHEGAGVLLGELERPAGCVLGVLVLDRIPAPGPKHTAQTAAARHLPRRALEPRAAAGSQPSGRSAACGGSLALLAAPPEGRAEWQSENRRDQALSV